MSTYLFWSLWLETLAPLFPPLSASITCLESSTIVFATSLLLFRSLQKWNTPHMQRIFVLIFKRDVHLSTWISNKEEETEILCDEHCILNHCLGFWSWSWFILQDVFFLQTIFIWMCQCLRRCFQKLHVNGLFNVREVNSQKKLWC